MEDDVRREFAEMKKAITRLEKEVADLKRVVEHAQLAGIETRAA